MSPRAQPRNRAGREFRAGLRWAAQRAPGVRAIGAISPGGSPPRV